MRGVQAREPRASERHAVTEITATPGPLNYGKTVNVQLYTQRSISAERGDFLLRFSLRPCAATFQYHRR